MKKGKLQSNYQLCSFPFEDFLASAGRVAVTEGGDLGGLGVIPQQAFWPEQSGQNRKTCICLHCLPICESLNLIYLQYGSIKVASHPCGRTFVSLKLPL